MSVEPRVLIDRVTAYTLLFYLERKFSSDVPDVSWQSVMNDLRRALGKQEVPYDSE